MLGITHVSSITISALDGVPVSQVSDAVSNLLRIRHRIDSGAPDDFTIRTFEEMASVLTSTTTTMTYLLASVAAVSLLVGGIGIMNIMLVSVTERTREVGLRLSLGARRRDVLRQFLVEALALGLAGGVVGVVPGDWRLARPEPGAELDDAGLRRSGGGVVRLRRRDRRLLRLLSRPPRRRAQSDGRAALRVRTHQAA